MAEHTEGGGSHADEHHGIGHVLPLSVLFGTLGALLLLTVLTVYVYTHPIFDPETHAGLNLMVALVIAAVKATLVCLFFMHLLYDRLLHTVVFLSSVLFFLLFVTFCLMDRAQYEGEVRWNQARDPVEERWNPLPPSPPPEAEASESEPAGAEPDGAGPEPDDAEPDDAEPEDAEPEPDDGEPDDAEPEAAPTP